MKKTIILIILISIIAVLIVVAGCGNKKTTTVKIIRIIALEEHWCPRELFEDPGTPGYASMQAVRNMGIPGGFESACEAISDIGERRIAMMDSLGIDVQVLSLCSANMEMLSPEQALFYSKLSNDILAEGMKAYPDRLKGMAAIPTPAPDEAAKEIERIADIPGFVGVIVNGHINGHYLDEPQFEPILAACERYNLPIYIHPAVPPKAVVEASYKMADPYAQGVLVSGGWGWHIETGTHVLRLIGSGAFDRHPGLKVIVGHLGEGLPFFMQRLYNATGGNLRKPWPEYLRDNVWYTISGFHDPDLLEFVLRKVGPDHVMFSADYPFMPAGPEVKFILDAPIGEDVREKICHSNAEVLLGL